MARIVYEEPKKTTSKYGKYVCKMSIDMRPDDDFDLFYTKVYGETPEEARARAEEELELFSRAKLWLREVYANG